MLREIALVAREQGGNVGGHQVEFAADPLCFAGLQAANAEVGMGDSYAFFAQTDSAAVATSSTNMTPVSTSNARGHGFPGIFENESFSSLLDIGGVQHNPTQLFAYPGMSGGMSD